MHGDYNSKLATDGAMVPMFVDVCGGLRMFADVYGRLWAFAGVCGRLLRFGSAWVCVDLCNRTNRSSVEPRARRPAAGVGPRADDAVDHPSHAGRFERVCVPTMHALPGAAPAALAWRDTP